MDIEKNANKYTLKGFDAREALEVKHFGNGCHVTLPTSWAGKKVTVILLE